MLNRIVLIGRLTRDPELRYTQSGIARTSFTLAVDRNFKSASGEKETDFIDIVAWRQLGETCSNYLSKGKLVAVEGSLHIRSYQAQDGANRRIAEVIADNVQFLSPKDSGMNNSASYQQVPPIANQEDSPFANGMDDQMLGNDDLPF